MFAQQRHESVFQLFHARFERGVGQERAQRGLVAIGLADEPHPAAARHGIDDAVGRVDQPGLEDARGHARRRRGFIGQPFCPMAELFGRPLGQQAAAIDDEDIGAARGFVHIGGADDHAQVLALDQLFENGPQIATRQRIDADAGLVEQEQVGRADQRAGKAELLLHAPRQLSGRTRGEARHVGHFQHPRKPLAPLFHRYAVEVGIKVEVFLHAQVFVKAEALRHVADAVLHGLGTAAYVLAQNLQGPGVGPQQPRHHPHQGRLARAVRPGQRGQGARPDTEREIVDGIERLSVSRHEDLAQALCDNGKAGIGHRLPRFKGRGHRLSQAQVVARIVHPDPHFVDEAGPQVLGLDRLGREFGYRGDIADPARDILSGHAVGRHFGGKPHANAAKVGFGHIDAHPFGVGECKVEHRFLGRCLIAGLKQSRPDDAVRGRDQMPLIDLVLEQGQLGLGGGDLRTRPGNFLFARADPGEAQGLRLFVGAGLCRGGVPCRAVEILSADAAPVGPPGNVAHAFEIVLRAGGLRLRIGELGPAFGDFLGPRPVEQLAQVLLLLVELGPGLLCLQLQSHGVEFGKHGSRVDLIAFLGVHADDPAIAVESQRDLTKIDIAVEDDFPLPAFPSPHPPSDAVKRPRQPMASFLIP
jgi:hypothetical protein